MKCKPNNSTTGKRIIFSLTFIAAIILMVTNVYAQLPKPDHIVLVVEENKSYSNIIDNNSAPYINGLVADNFGALFTQSYAVTHPSQPNYLYLFSGDNQGITDDGLPSGLPFTTNNLGAELLRNDYTFVGYSEDLPSIGYNGNNSGAYYRKHNPWVNWQNSSINGIDSILNVPFTEFPNDYNKLPTVSFVVPNNNNNMHDGSISTADTWLQNNLDGYIQWAKTNNSLFILTFDEDDNSLDNWIPTIFIGQMVKKGFYSVKINHLNLLRTIEDMYGLNPVGKSGDSVAIPSSCWLNAIPVELIYFSAAIANNKVTLNWTTASETNNLGFDVEISKDNQLFKKIAFVPGFGTSTEKHNYTYCINKLLSSTTYCRLKQIDFDGSFSYSEVIEVDAFITYKFILDQNYPNPFNPNTTIKYSIPVSGNISLKVYNVLGQEVKTIFEGYKQPGNYEVTFNGSGLASGVYLYKFKTENFVETKKMLLIK